ncbi:MAG: M6 family metalloprotease domain-containing protein, partial [Endomicrobiales bacterium]|nr:M6 family metalloprotease domain-containing protein [Endomicrobiales bacterium]
IIAFSYLKMKKTAKVIFLLLSFLLIYSDKIFPAPHKNGLNTGVRDYVRPRPKYDKKTLKAMGYSPDKIKGVISPAIGTQKVAVVLVEFLVTDASTTGAPALTSEDLLRFVDTFNYLKNFYKEASYNKLDVDITFFYNGGSSSTLTGTENPYILNRLMSYYGQDTEDTLEELVTESINAVGAQLSTATYSAVIVAHAGYGNESTKKSGDITSAVIVINSTNNVNGFTDGAIVPARESGGTPRGVTCHEFGHILGLPDIYETDAGTSKVGVWCLMDYGTWVDDGYSPTHPSVWCKKYLGWVNPIIVNDDQDITNMSAFETCSSTVYQLPILGSNSEYFLICYSSKSSYNSNPLGEGILIWHIDEGDIDGTSFNYRMAYNAINNFTHTTVGIIPADSTHPLNVPHGDSTDPWPGVKQVFTSPDSDSYTGQPSGISIGNITIGYYADFKVTNIEMSSVVNIQKIINFPNPAGSDHYHPLQNSGIITTFSFNFNRAPRDIDLTIYNTAGEKVLYIPKDQIVFNLDKSNDYKVIYEYNWDGRNEKQENVAPGLYFYRVRADNETKTGKMAIIR